MKTSIFTTLFRVFIILITAFVFCFTFYCGYQLTVMSAEYDPMLLLITFPALGLLGIVLLMTFASIISRRNLFKK